MVETVQIQSQPLNPKLFLVMKKANYSIANTGLFLLEKISWRVKPRATENNGLGSYSQRAELGLNQGTFSALGTGDPDSVFFDEFQNLYGEVIALCFPFFLFSNRNVYCGFPVLVLILPIGYMGMRMEMGNNF